MNKRRFLALCLAAAFAVIATSVALASSQKPTSSHSGGANANQIGVVRIDANDPTVAYVTGRYTCPPSTEPAHLFVSVKQGAGGLPDPALKGEGSGALADAWLFRHPGPTDFTCDGTWHTGTWQISSHEPPPDDYGQHGSLVPGTVYVQFCWDSPDGSWHAYSEQFARASY
jgi:hypothetical protein